MNLSALAVLRIGAVQFITMHFAAARRSERRRKEWTKEEGFFDLLLRLRPPSNDHSKGKGGEGGG